MSVRLLINPCLWSGLGCLLSLRLCTIQMYIKLQDLEPEQLPQEFFTAMQTSLAPWYVRMMGLLVQKPAVLALYEPCFRIERYVPCLQAYQT